MKPAMTDTTKIRVKRLGFSYRSRTVLHNVSLECSDNAITALTGPSGVGKSTFLMTLNRLWENIPETEMTGTVEIKLHGIFRDVYARSMPLTELRKKVGMVFQTPNPLPMSIRRNILFPLKIAGEKNSRFMEERLEQVLTVANLWNEVKDRLKDDARTLSGGQQQRLCIARALVLEPEVLLLDEPTSSLDRASTAVIEELLIGLKENLCILVVSHYLEQVARIADRTVCFEEGGVLA
jgi:phosphate transport system ATP-binding protein